MLLKCATQEMLKNGMRAETNFFMKVTAGWLLCTAVFRLLNPPPIFTAFYTV
jgi:hypothetical protein